MSDQRDANSQQPPRDAAGADFRPSASLEMLEHRARVLGAIRNHFADTGYCEVETPILSHDVVVDAYLEPFVTSWQRDELFLQTSPEFAMKRLLAAGAKAIYQITRAFRKEEIGTLHNPEFTIVEWYRVGDTHREQMSFVEDLVAAAFEAVESARPKPLRPFDRLTYDEAFEKHFGARVLSLSDAELTALGRSRGVVPPPGLSTDDRDGWLNLLLAEFVEPKLGVARPTFLYDYPASQAALAKVRRDNPPVAERFELYVDGLELCNGYHELTDPHELRERIETQSRLRAADGRRGLPRESRLLEAMQAGLPECSGVALGFDRLMMAITGARSIAEVVAFPFERA